jgi:hypothetical protein
MVWAAAFAAAALVGGTAVAAAPLAAYVWLIALFGIPHVVAEMRYCDERFAGGTARPALALIGVLLAALATTRMLGTYGVVPGSIGGPLELILGATLAVAAALFMRRWRLLGFGIAATVIFGALYYPLATFLIWAWVHNLTPLGFVADALPRGQRWRAIALLCIPFFALPAFVALGGLDWIAFHVFGHDAARAPSAFGAGFEPLKAFLPPRTPMDHALPLFQAAVISQVMHYVAVIALLPRLLQHGAAREGRLAPWPSWPVFYAALALAGLASTAFYAIDFREARSAYALFATLHSWIELPIFLMALGGGFTAVTLRSASPPAAQTRTAPTPH